MTSLLNNLGGSAGFGEFSLARNDDGSTPFIDLRSIFGEQGIDFFGQYYTGLYLNNNGSVTFNTAVSSFTPTAITGLTNNPIIAAYWADVDTRGGPVAPTPGGTSTGTNLLWYDLDSSTHTFTATWDDVGYYNSQTNKLNAFQLSITEINDRGDFDIVFRYENIDWTTGSASGGSNGLGGVPARAGYSSGNGVEYFELPQSGDQAALLDLDAASNVGTPGTFVFQVRNGAPEVAISTGDASISEGNGPGSRLVSIPIFLTESSASTITVHYTTVNGTAVAGQDYVAQSGTLTFAPGVTQQNISVAIIGDTIVEGDEVFTIALSDPSEGASIRDDSGTVTILNDDASLSIAATNAAKAEGQSGSTPFTFTVTRTGDTSSAVSASWAVTGAAVNAADFTGGVLPTGTVSFAAGETSKVISIGVAGDTLVEANEAFAVTLSSPSAGATLGTASANGTIRNDDASLSIAATSAAKAEGQSGTTPFTFTVTRTGDTSSAVSASWAVTGAAVNAADFTGGVLPTGTVSFAAGETSKVISIGVAGDTLVEANEAFAVTLSSPSAGATLGTASANGTIRNDDASLSIAATSAAKAEGQSGTTPFTFTVTRTGDTSSAVSASWAVTGAAVNAADFTGGVLPTGTVSFAAGETSKVISIGVAGDTLVEANEAFAVTLSSPSAGATLGTASANGTIRNDDASLSIAATSAAKAEGQSGSTPFTFTVTRTGDTSGAVSASWAVTGAAVNAADFTGGVLPTGTVSFAAGETSKVISIGVAGDTLVEANEAFAVTLSSPSAGATLGTASANGTIRNDDASLSIAATSAAKAEGQSGSTPFTFTVTRTGDTSGAVSASWAVTGAAVNAADFTGGVLPTGTVSFAAGETSKVISIGVAGDTLVEANEAFAVTLSSPSAGATLGTASANGTIRNDDASLSIAATSAAKAEGQSGTTPFTFTVTRTGDTSSAVSASWAVTGAAVNAADFTGGVLPTGTVSFAAGETSKVISIGVAGDTLVEANEAFAVTLSSPSAGATLGTASANGTIRNDDASLSIAATSANQAEGQSGSTPFTFTVTRTGDTSSAVSASWAVTGAAVNAADFTGGVLPTGTVSFAAGETSKVISIGVAGDTLVEANEAFAVTLSSPSAGATLGTASANGTIRNDDASLSIAATSAAKAEGQSGTTPFTFTVTRTGDTSSAVSASWAVTGAAVNAADFTGGVLPTGTVSFAAGETSKVISIGVAGDTLVEANEAFAVTLSSPSAGATLGTASANGTIRNDDASLSMSIAATSADKAEGQSGVVPFTFTVTRTGDTSDAASVQWAVTGSEVLDFDFLPLGDLPNVLPLDTLSTANLISEIVSSFDDPNLSLWGGQMPFGTVNFAAGETSQTLTVWVVGDTLPESDESFAVTLSNASAGYSIGTPSAVGTIRNDDNPDAVRSNVSYTLGAGVMDLVLTGAADIDGTGNALDNQLVGNSGNNLLTGGAGNDILFGGAGSDTLIGGPGQDQLTGGAGADIFKFNAGDSSVASFDTITDLQQGTDKIDLSAMGAFHLLVQAGAAFTGAPGELRFYNGTGASTFIAGDVNGDAHPDFQIQLAGSFTMKQSDFL